MGSIVNGITGLFSGGGGSSANSNAGSIAGLGQIGGQQDILAQQLDTQGGSIYGPSFDQFTGGISGQLTPAQQSLVTENLGTMNTATQGQYSGLGLGGSTMEGQDINANALRSMSEQANLNFLNESTGLQGLDEALKYFGGAGTELGGAARSIGAAGDLQTENTKQLNSAIGSLGNKSAGGLGSGVQSIASGLGLGSGGAGAAGTGAVDAGTFDLGGAATAGAGALGGDAALGAAGAGAGDLLGTGAGLAGADALGAGTATAAGKGAADLIPALALAA